MSCRCGELLLDALDTPVLRAAGVGAVAGHRRIGPGVTGGARNSNEGQPGPIYLQGSEKGHVLFRKVEIAPAK